MSKIDFPIGHFYVTIPDADVGGLKFLHILYGKYLGYMLVNFEQDRTVRHIQKLNFWQKMVNHFWESADAILEDLSVTKTIVDDKVLIERLSSFIVPKIMVIRRV